MDVLSAGEQPAPRALAPVPLIFQRVETSTKAFVDPPSTIKATSTCETEVRGRGGGCDVRGRFTPPVGKRFVGPTLAGTRYNSVVKGGTTIARNSASKTGSTSDHGSAHKRRSIRELLVLQRPALAASSAGSGRESVQASSAIPCGYPWPCVARGCVYIETAEGIRV